MSGASWESHFGGKAGAGWHAASTSAPNPGDIALHYDGSDITTLYSDDEATTLIAGADENVIRAWAPKQGNSTGTMVSGAADTDVVYLASFQNSLGAVRYDHVDAEITAEVATAGFSNDGSRSVVCVASVDETTAETFLWYVVDDVSAFASGVAVEGGEIKLYLDGEAVDTEGLVTDTTVFAVVYSHDYTTGEVLMATTVGGDLETFESAGIVADGLTVGENIIGHASGAVGNLGEYILYEGLHDLDRLKQYVTNKWGLTWS
jgi:hypothetical protein